MIAASLFLPIGLLATQITISEVSTERAGGHLAITVKGDAMIDPEAVSTKMGEGHLYLYVRDARVHEDNRAWKNDAVEGGDQIRAHRHPQKVELAVPLGEGCQGPVELEKTEGGLRALVGCDEAPRAGATRVARMLAASHAEAQPERPAESKPAVSETESGPASKPRLDKLAAAPTPSPLPVASLPEAPAIVAVAPRTIAPAHMPASEAAELRAKLVLALPKALLEGESAPAPAPAPASTAASTTAPARPVPAEAPKVAAAPAAVVAPPAAIATAPAPPAPIAALVTAPAPPAPVAVSGGSNGNGGGGGVVLAGLLLVGIACAAFFFSRRRAIGTRHIRIIETASLGPKRALVMARVGDSTLILGSSEAGITLLQTVPDARTDIPAVQGFASLLAAASAPSVSVAPPARGEDAPLDAATPAVPVTGMRDLHMDSAEPANEETAGFEASFFTDEPAPSGQAGLLARIFHRRSASPANDASLASARFEDLLEDSFEDQELRRKLSLGMSGRVR